MEVPFEFRPKVEDGDAVVDEDLDMFGSLFVTRTRTETTTATKEHSEEPPSGDDDDANKLVSVEVATANLTFFLLQPPDIGTFFAHQIWSGSKLLAEYMYQHKSLVFDKTTVELGAGTGLPSLMALHLQSKVSVLTDYPNEEMMQTLRETIGHNWSICGSSVDYKHQPKQSEGGPSVLRQPEQSEAGSPRLPSPEQRVAVVGHAWGTSTQPVLQALQSLLASTWSSPSSTTSDEVDPQPTTTPASATFDVALLSECLWNHALHAQLAQSLDQLVHPEHGIALITYAHHIPGLEEQDDAFFRLCEQTYGFQTESVLSKAMPYMWDETKTIEIHLKLLSRSTSAAN